MKRVLLIAVLLRFMDSFMIYTEPVVLTGGGPGNSTTFLSIDLVKMALGQFDLGPAAAMSLIYFLIILLLSWVFYTVMTTRTRRTAMRRLNWLVADDLHRLPAAADLLAAEHVLQDQQRDPRRLHAVAAALHAGELRARSSPTRTWYMGYVNSLIYVVMNTVISVTVALPAAYAFSRYRFLGDKHLFFWLLTNRMAPPAVFALPFFQLYSAIGLFDTHIAVALAHCLFNMPLAVWILEGFMSRRAEGARRDRLSSTATPFWQLLRQDLHADIAAGIGVAASSASCSPGSSCCSPRR